MDNDETDSKAKDSRGLLTDVQVSEWIGTPVGTIRNWRVKGIGPPFIKMGDGRNSTVRYDPKDIEKYIDVHRRFPSVTASFPAPIPRIKRTPRNATRAERDALDARIRKQTEYS